MVSNYIEVFVLESINFLGFEPKIGFLEIDNIFTILTQNINDYYDTISIYCSFVTKNARI